MKFKVKINDIDIPSDHIINISTSEVSFVFAGERLISSKTTIELSNHNYRYDERQKTNGFFEKMEWYNSIVSVFNYEDRLIWEGRLKKIEIKDSKMTTTLTVNDYVQDLVDTVCVINAMNETVSEVIWSILTDPNYLAIPESRLIRSGFEIASSQQLNSKITIGYTAQDNQKCISVLEELCRISNSHIFIRDNKIGYWVWTRYIGTLGVPVYAKDLLPNSYDQLSDDSKILNEYSIAWNNNGIAEYAADRDELSQNLYGSGKIFAVPTNEVDSSYSSAFKIIFTSKAAADEAGQSSLLRYKNIKRTCSFSTGDSFDFVSLGDILDLRFSPFVWEPVRVVEIKSMPEKKQIEFTCEHINNPQVIDLDIEPPVSVYLYEPVLWEGRILLRWTISNKNDIMSYKIYFSFSENYWGDEFSNGKFSPIVIPANNIEMINNDCSYFFDIMNNEGKVCYFKISIVAKSYNESEHSNVVSISIPFTSDLLKENIFNLKGDIWSGFVLDIANSKGGIKLPEWAGFDNAKFGVDVFSPTAVYESPVLTKTKGFSHIKYSALCKAGDIKLQQKNCEKDIPGEWSSPEVAEILGLYELKGKKLQYRIIFNSNRWSNKDKFIVREIA